MNRHRLLAVAATVVLSSLGAACGSSESGSDGSSTSAPTVVVTTAILGDLVGDLVGDRADVEVLIPNGQDPHEFEPSAKDIAALGSADLVVANGLDLEEGLLEAIEQARSDGTPVFHAADHVTVRDGDEDHHEESSSESSDTADAEHDHEHAGGDPHIWTDPLTMAEMVPELATALGSATGADLSGDADRQVAELEALSARVAATMAAIPAGECKLVTGHESLGYFADRYGCEIIGAVIPNLSSTSEASAGALADLRAAASAAGVRAVFTEAGTPPEVAEQVASEVGVPLVELPSERLPASGGYAAFVEDLASGISEALAPA